MERATVFSRALIINVFSITYSADHNNITLGIKQDPVIASAQPIRRLRCMQTLDIAVKPVLQALNLAKDLRAHTRWQTI
ncbi:hypothetical protein SBV1_1620015 [Verrucomicrobia bacterium]|nr:hypothetical protein SBV1_1620015 [Verrucomicrobiota bacterium]